MKIIARKDSNGTSCINGTSNSQKWSIFLFFFLKKKKTLFINRYSLIHTQKLAIAAATFPERVRLSFALFLYLTYDCVWFITKRFSTDQRVEMRATLSHDAVDRWEKKKKKKKRSLEISFPERYRVISLLFGNQLFKTCMRTCVITIWKD